MKTHHRACSYPTEAFSANQPSGCFSEVFCLHSLDQLIQSWVLFAVYILTMVKYIYLVQTLLNARLIYPTVWSMSSHGCVSEITSKISKTKLLISLHTPNLLLPQPSPLKSWHLVLLAMQTLASFLTLLSLFYHFLYSILQQVLLPLHSNYEGSDHSPPPPLPLPWLEPPSLIPPQSLIVTGSFLISPTKTLFSKRKPEFHSSTPAQHGSAFHPE